MYTVMNYGQMAADGARMDAYARAIARAVKPGSIVMDLGAGTGIVSLLALRAGARKVYAVDVNPTVLLAPELARENGFPPEALEVHLASSTDLTLIDRADVIVSDIRGNGPLKGDHFEIIQDARKRHLAPNGVLIPVRDRLHVALIESRELTADLEHAVRGFDRYGWSAATMTTSMLNTVCSVSVSASDVLTTAKEWSVLDYTLPMLPTVVEGTVDLEVLRGGRANALVVWFEMTTLDELGFTTAPGHASVYSRLVLPLSQTTQVVDGDQVRIDLRSDARGDRWGWDTTIRATTGASKAQLRQSTFFGLPTTPEFLLRSSSNHIPARSPFGERTVEILRLMDGQRTVKEITDSLTSQQPTLSYDAALNEVRGAVSRFAR